MILFIKTLTKIMFFIQIVVSLQLLNINGYFPQNAYPIKLKSGSILKLVI
jgi:hypothetical protein